MGTASIKRQQQQGGVPAGVRPTALVMHKTLEKLLKPLYKAIGISTDGLDVMETANGIHLRALASRGDSFPFQARVTQVEDESTVSVIIAPGTVSGLMPTLGGTDLDDGTPPVLTIANTGTFKIYLEINATLTPTTENYVVSWTIDSVTVESDSSIPDDLLTGTYRRHIATIVDGVLTAQVVQNSLEVTLLDDGTATAQALIAVGLSG